MSGPVLKENVRTKIETFWSYIETAAIKVGDGTLELMGGENGGKYWINGHPGKELVDKEVLSLAGFKVVYHKVSDKQQKFRIELGRDGDAVSLQTYKNWVQVTLKVKDPTKFQNTFGLLGKYPNGEMVVRDKTTVLTDANSFGKAWQVLESEPMLFHDLGEGVHHPTACVMPSLEASATRRRRLGESAITEEDATIACVHADVASREACIFDVLATNDKEMSGAY